ncbi:MAG: hypothetical protein ACOX2F_12350 [bacterium]
MKKTNVLGIVASILSFLFFFVWGTKGKPLTVLTAFYPTFHLILLAVIVVLYGFFFIFPNLPTLTFTFLTRHRYKIFPFIGFLFPALIAVFVFDSIPHVIDATHFLWTARVFIETGSFHLPASELYEYYQNTFNVEINNRFFSLFLPGFSIFLVPFELLGISHFFTPLCNGIAVLLLGKIADRQTNDPRISIFSMIFAVFSSFYLFMGASYMSHSFNLALTLFAIYLIISFKKPWAYILAGTSGAILLFIRPQNAVFLYLAALAFILLKSEKTKKAESKTILASYLPILKKMFFFTIPFIVIGFLLLFHNYFYTGHPTLFPQDVYFSIREPFPLCHRLGLGKGCPNTEGDFLPEGGLTLKYAFWVAFTKITLMNFNLSGHPLIFVFVTLAFAFSFKKSIEMAVFFIVSFAGYFFFYLPGNLFGPRYLAETASLLFIPAGIAFFAILDSQKKWIKPLIVALPFAMAVFLSTIIMPTLITEFTGNFWDTDREVEKAIEKEGIKNSIVFVPRLYGSVYLNLMEKPPYDRHGNLILLDLGAEENSYATAYYMEKEGFKNAYTIDYFSKAAEKTAVSPIFVQIRDKAVFEFEDKRLPKTGKPDYGVNFSMSEEVDKKFYPVKQLDIEVSNESVFAMYFENTHDKSYYDFSHPLLEPGEYSVNLYYVSDKCGTDFAFEINGKQVATFSSYSEIQQRDSLEISLHLEAGNNFFKIIPLRGISCLMLDNMVMELK